MPESEAAAEGGAEAAAPLSELAVPESEAAAEGAVEAAAPLSQTSSERPGLRKKGWFCLPVTSACTWNYSLETSDCKFYDMCTLSPACLLRGRVVQAASTALLPAAAVFAYNFCKTCRGGLFCRCRWAARLC